MREEKEPYECREPEGTFLLGTPETEGEEVSRIHAGDRTPIIISTSSVTQ